MSIIKSDPIIEYSDYRKFVNFIDNKYKLALKNINPYEYFRINKCRFRTGVSPKDLASSIFKGRSVNMPNFNIDSNSFNKISRFEDFTSTDEVRNLSLWALSCLKTLSYERTVRLGKELEIIQGNNPRDGRLDVVALCQKQLLIFEVKVGLASLLREGRYKYQIPAYLKESLAIINKHNKDNGKNKNVKVILLIGGEEGDIYPEHHPDCTSGQVGNISSIFYDSVEEYEINFVTANALWSIGAYSEVFNKKVYWNDLISNIFSQKQNIGLVSGGIVTLKDNELEVVPIDLLRYV